jgi:hypothetical protein
MRIFFKDTDRIPDLPLGLTAVYRLAGQHPEYEAPHRLRVGSEFLHGCRVIQRWTVPGTDVATVRELLMNIKTYGDRGMGARCYFPGFAFTFGQSTATVDVLVCLECRWVVFHFGEQSVSIAPTDNGLARLREIYQTVIEKVPTHAAS